MISDGIVFIKSVKAKVKYLHMFIQALFKATSVGDLIKRLCPAVSVMAHP